MISFIELFKFIWRHRYDNILHCKCKERDCMLFQPNRGWVSIPTHPCPYLSEKKHKVFFIDSLDPIYRQKDINEYKQFLEYEKWLMIKDGMKWLFPPNVNTKKVFSKVVELTQEEWERLQKEAEYLITHGLSRQFIQQTKAIAAGELPKNFKLVKKEKKENAI